MNKLTLALIAGVAATMSSGLACAQASPADRAATDRAVAQKRAAMRAAYASHNARRIAETRAASRAADTADWKADHPGRRAVRHGRRRYAHD